MSNMLKNETSPYLLQHTENPVNWYPWRQEAFEKARAEDKPIFLSIGYSSCHWCHVMAHESFESLKRQRFLTKNLYQLRSTERNVLILTAFICLFVRHLPAAEAGQ